MKRKITLTFECSANLASFYTGKFKETLREHGATNVEATLT